MQVAEASVVVPLSPEQTWDLLFGNPQQGVVELFADIVSVEGFQIRDDGTPPDTGWCERQVRSP